MIDYVKKGKEKQLKALYCFNPMTGRRDGKYCVWEGEGKCQKCTAADRIAEQAQQLTALCKLLQTMIDNKKLLHYKGEGPLYIVSAGNIQAIETLLQEQGDEIS